MPHLEIDLEKIHYNANTTLLINFLNSSGVTLSIWIFIIFDIELAPVLFLFIGNFFIPIALFFWIYSVSHILYQNYKTQICFVTFVIGVSYEIYLIVCLSINPSLIGTVERFNSIPNFVALVFQVSTLIVAVITGIIFSLKTMKINKLEVKWRGRFLLIAFLSFFISTLLDAVLLLNMLTLIIIRLILISSSIEYYFGFFPPDKVLKFLIKNEKKNSL